MPLPTKRRTRATPSGGKSQLDEHRIARRREIGDGVEQGAVKVEGDRANHGQTNLFQRRGRRGAENAEQKPKNLCELCVSAPSASEAVTPWPTRRNAPMTES